MLKVALSLKELKRTLQLANRIHPIELNKNYEFPFLILIDLSVIINANDYKHAQNNVQGT